MTDRDDNNTRNDRNDKREQDEKTREEAVDEVADVAATLNADMVIDPERERPPDAPSGEDVVPRHQGTP